MFDDLRSLIKEHHAFYEVSPYYVLLQERHASSPPTTQRVQAGFDVEIYGVNKSDEMEAPRSTPVYSLGRAELQGIAERICDLTNRVCCLEVISFPSRFVVDARNQGKVAGMFRIRISHYRGIDQPACIAEQHVLEELENELQRLGVFRR